MTHLVIPDMEKKRMKADAAFIIDKNTDIFLTPLSPDHWLVLS